MGEFTTSRISRRALLLQSGGALAASTASAAALVAESPGGDTEPSNRLRALIEAHKTVYAALCEALHGTGGGSNDAASASRDEERALLAICGYAAIGEGDRLAKAGYLLEIEARGELDLAEHIQAILRSTMWKRGDNRHADG